MKSQTYTTEINGQKIEAVLSDLADQANGSVILKADDTTVMATAVMSKEVKEDIGFFNLTVEYLEKFYASGEILGGRFIKREGRPSDEAVLSARVIDRTIRPLFDHRIKNAVQVVVTVLSVGRFDPGILGINAASLALGLSDIPWNGPVGAIHISKTTNHENQLRINKYLPKNKNTEDQYSFQLSICGKDGKINVIEGDALESSEAEAKEAFELANEQIKQLEEFQKETIKKAGKEKQEIDLPEFPDRLLTLFDKQMKEKIDEAFKKAVNKSEINELQSDWKNTVKENFTDESEEDKKAIKMGGDLFKEKLDEKIHQLGIKEDRRVDGREMDKVREIYTQAGGMSKTLHGSGVFYRGQTHMLSVLTLGGPQDAQILEGMEVKEEKRFMHHYNFPPYSVGETGRVGGMNRREIGHGALAEKALSAVIPKQEEFPYTIRLVSESTASNGSTSQAAICASTLALMDGGVPIKAPVAGIAMGLLYENEDNYKILTDIQGPEDHFGDMDFKIAGTKEGLTALQLDVKLHGVSTKILGQALDQAKKAREKIINDIENEIAEPREKLAENAPIILKTKVQKDQIGLVVGSGGKTINEIQEKYNVDVNIEDDGKIHITGTKEDQTNMALNAINEIVKEWSVDEKTQGEVVKILDEVGAIVKISPYAEGLVHISEIAPFRVKKVSDVLQEGQTVPVKVIGIDKERDRISLSIKSCDENFIEMPKSYK